MPSTAHAPAQGRLTAPPPLELTATAVFADLDGTLAPIELTPDRVGPDADRRRLLEALGQALHGRLAIVSGRALADLERVLEGRVPAIAAVHGLVRRRADGQVVTAADGAALRPVLAAFRAFTARDSRLLVEDKSLAVSLHYRRAPEAAEAAKALAGELARDHGLTVQAGDMVVEVRAPGPDKGAALEAFMTEPPFAGATPIFLGDDLTDEDAFRAADALGGYGVVVGPRRPSAARYALANVAAARAWLGAAVERSAP